MIILFRKRTGEICVGSETGENERNEEERGEEEMPPKKKHKHKAAAEYRIKVVNNNFSPINVHIFYFI